MESPCTKLLLTALALSCVFAPSAFAGPMPATSLSILGFTRGPVPGISIRSPRDIQVRNGYAYITDEPNGALDVVDVRNPTSPVLTTSLPGVCGAAKGIAIQGTTAFLGCAGENAVKVFDISNPLSPSFVTAFTGPVPGTTLKGVWTVQPYGHYLYALSRDSLTILDIADPFLPSFVSNTALPSTGDIPRDIVFRGDNAYIATNNGLYIYDVSDPTNLVALGYTQGAVPGTTLKQARTIELVGNYALVAANLQQAVATIDITDPNNPIYIDSFSGPDPGVTFAGITDLFVSGNVAYTTNDVAYTVGIFDISDPTNLSWIGELPRNTTELSGVQQFASDGDYLYYITHDLGGVGVLTGNGAFDIPYFSDQSISVTEPGGFALLGAGLAGAARWRRRNTLGR